MQEWRISCAVKSYRLPTGLLCKTGKFIETSEKEKCLHTHVDPFPPSASRPGRVRQGKAKEGGDRGGNGARN